jgi:hypothetical protein
MASGALQKVYCHMVFKLPIALIFLIPSLNGVAQEDWKLKKDKDGIKVYTQHVEGSSLKAIKAETTFNCSIHTCVAILKDIPNLIELFPDCEKAELVAQSELEQIHYLHLNAPWPVSDRDATFHLQYEYDATTETLMIQADVINDKYPEQKGLVRLTKGIGTWDFHRIGDDKTSLVYRFHGEPGGSIPAWLANSVVEENPLKMLENFHSLIKLKRYQEKHFDFIQ